MGRSLNNEESYNRVVSSDDEQLILVDSDDREIGHLAKADAHLGSGTLHRAFSVFVFSPAGELLVQQRAESKRLWPGYWSNTCCSHPRLGETMDGAVHRRLQEELGLSAELEFLFKFQYQSQYDSQGAEHELCWVYAGHSAERPRANVHEIAAWRYVTPQALCAEIACAPETFTPWFKLEWERLLRDHPQALGGPDPG
ncbi:Isopentenyldiphosphate isomerase [Mycobacterium numidiamassiliense]|uniref:Isopentenyl-diphosphate Delta-isomerase n=1 Tax=Mycobacterium numidiamassiliense TaxID=1841861 RepID=A0A2U3P2H0_9MYCO|nr:isopentenyl-diphosphate Delta-isomerase [Mycobacterium numidiamassiliense]SPM37895.1 Isopentenyldiphosphate isomerase [Mycobacterium numidiamassiliense]